MCALHYFSLTVFPSLFIPWLFTRGIISLYFIGSHIVICGKKSREEKKFDIIFIDFQSEDFALLRTFFFWCYFLIFISKDFFSSHSLFTFSKRNTQRWWYNFFLKIWSQILPTGWPPHSAVHRIDASAKDISVVPKISWILVFANLGV